MCEQNIHGRVGRRASRVKIDAFPFLPFDGMDFKMYVCMKAKQTPDSAAGAINYESADPVLYILRRVFFLLLLLAGCFKLKAKPGVEFSRPFSVLCFLLCVIFYATRNT